MKNIKEACVKCGSKLVVLASFNSEGLITKCTNLACISNNKHTKCPRCGQRPTSIEVLGLGNSRFRCKNNHEWSSLKK